MLEDVLTIRKLFESKICIPARLMPKRQIVICLPVVPELTEAEVQRVRSLVFNKPVHRFRVFADGNIVKRGEW